LLHASESEFGETTASLSAASGFDPNGRILVPTIVFYWQTVAAAIKNVKRPAKRWKLLEVQRNRIAAGPAMSMGQEFYANSPYFQL
jgi:hypothetical protein